MCEKIITMLSFIVDSDNRKLVVVLCLSVASLISFLIFVACFIYWRRRRAEGKYSNDVPYHFTSTEKLKEYLR